MLLRGIAALVAGAAVGVGVALVLQPSAPSGAAADDCASRRTQAQAELDGVSEQITKVEREVYAARLRRAAALGKARTWPQEPHPLLTERALDGHIRAALRDGPGELLELDCSAYPCVASISWEHLPEDEGLIDRGNGEANMPGRLLAQLQGGAGYADLPFAVSGRMHTVQDGVSVFGMTWYSPEDYRASKAPDDVESAQLDGTVLDQISGRTEQITDDWSERSLP